MIQNDLGNEHSPYTVIVAISSAPLPRAFPFTVPLPKGQANLPRPGHVNCAQLLTVDQSRLKERIGELPAETMAAVSAALRYELAL